MKLQRIYSESPVKGYSLFRWARVTEDGEGTIYPTYHILHRRQTVSAGTDRLNVAQAKIKQAAGDEAHEYRKQASAVDTRVGALLDLVITDHDVNGRNADDVKNKIESALRPYFGDKIAESVNSDTIDGWIEWRRQWRRQRAGTKRTARATRQASAAEIKPATINRELAILRRAFKLGYRRRPQLVKNIPPITMLRVQNVRKGFVTPQQYRNLMVKLPAYLRPITCIAFHIGNRRGELLNLQWSDVELEGTPPVLTLWPGETKSGDGRTLPILPGEMMKTLRVLKTQRDAEYPEQQYVFTEGPKRLGDFRKSWAEACKLAGLPGLLFHDLRRSAVRNLRRAGVSEKIAMGFSGHKTRAVFDRYDISDFADMTDAAKRLGTYLGEDKQLKKTRKTAASKKKGTSRGRA